MEMNLLVTSVLAAIVGAIAGFVAGRLGGRKPLTVAAPAFGMVAFFGSPQNRIGKVFPEILRVHPGAAVHWTIVDIVPLPGGPPGRVELKWINHPDHASQPLPNNNPFSSIDHDQPNRRIKAMVRADVRPGEKYRFQVLVGNVIAADPDVEIMEI